VRSLRWEMWPPLNDTPAIASSRARDRGRLASLFCFALLLAYVWAVVIPAARNPETNGFASYYTASSVLLQRPGDVPRVYDNAWFQSRIDERFRHVKDIFNVQPPTMTLLMAPLAWLPPTVARVAWIAVAVAFWMSGSVVLYSALSEHALGIRSVLVLLASTAAFVPLGDNLRQGQAYALLFFLLAGHFRLLLRRGTRTSWFAGIPLGCMLMLKLAGAWLWPLLLLSRQWRTVAAAALTCLTIALLCSPFLGWSAWQPFFRDLPQLASDPTRYVVAYQTVTSLLGHLFAYDPTWSPHPIANYPLLARLSTMLLTIVSVVQSLRFERLRSDCLLERALSLAMFGALVVCLSPVAESYHYLLVLPTVIITWWRALSLRPGITSWAVVVSGTLLLVVPQNMYGSPAIRDGWLALFAYPRVYGAFVLWGWLGRALSGLRQHASATTNG
jgi:hypothetical protein